MRERIDLGTRTAGEKARLADEFITKSQLIAGTGVTLDVQDNYDIMVSMDINQGMQYMMVEQGTDSSASDTDPISNMLSFSTNGNSLYQVEYILEVNVMLASTMYIFLSGNPTMTFKGTIEQTSAGTDQMLNSPTTAQRTIFNLSAGSPITTKTIFPGFKTTLIKLKGYVETGAAGGVITLSIGSSISGNFSTLKDRSYLFVTPMIVENYGEPPTDEKAGIVYGDTAGYLSEKIIAGDGIDVSIDDTDPSNQTLVITNTNSGGSFPPGTEEGQILYWNGSAWLVTSQIKMQNNNTEVRIKSDQVAVYGQTNHTKLIESTYRDNTKLATVYLLTNFGVEKNIDTGEVIIFINNNADNTGKFLRIKDSTGEVEFVDVPALLTVKRTLTPNEIRALGTTPIELVAAPGTNKFLFLHGWVAYQTYGVQAYTGDAEISYNEVNYVDANTDSISLNHTSDNVLWSNRAYTGAASSKVINKGLVIKQKNAISGASATGTLTIVLTYEIIDLS